MQVNTPGRKLLDALLETDQAVAKRTRLESPCQPHPQTRWENGPHSGSCFSRARKAICGGTSGTELENVLRYQKHF
jgi:hypothetical protein